MKINLFLFTLFLTCASLSSAWSQSRPDEPVSRIIKLFDDAKSREVLVVAHRGDWHNFPENSLEAVLSAVKMGVDIVEIDLQMTKDGHLVLMHDKTVDRVTAAKGEVRSFTLDSLRKLGLKNGIGSVTRFKIPTLEEVMVAVKGKAMVNLDKGYDFLAPSLAILQKTGTLDHAIAKSEHPAERVLADHGQALKQLRYMPVINLDKPGAAALLAGYDKTRPPAFEMIFRADTSVLLNKFQVMRDKGARIWVNTLWSSLCAGHEDDRAVTGDLAGSYDWVIAHGANIIQTDRPEFLLEYLRKRGLHR